MSDVGDSSKRDQEDNRRKEPEVEILGEDQRDEHFIPNPNPNPPPPENQHQNPPPFHHQYPPHNGPFGAYNANFHGFYLQGNMGNPHQNQPPPFNQHPNNGPNNQYMSVNQWSVPQLVNDYACIAIPDEFANRIPQKPSVINMVQHNQFGGGKTEDPNAHLTRFTQLCKSIIDPAIPRDYILMNMFPYSLRDGALDWLIACAPGSFRTWRELNEAFLKFYYPPRKTMQLRHELITFRQFNGETLYDAWERFKKLQRQCPHHGLNECQLVQTFYGGIEYALKCVLDASANGSILDYPVDYVLPLIDKIARNHHDWGNDRQQQPQRSAGVLQLDEITMLTAKVDALNRKIETLTSPPQGTQNAFVATGSDTSTRDYVQDSSTYYPYPLEVEEVQYVNRQYQGGNSNAYSATYNPGWRNHPNFGWRNQPQQTNTPVATTAPYVPPQKRTEPTTAAPNQFDMKSMMDCMAEMQKQITQLTTELAEQRKKGQLPSQPEANPKAQCKAIELRSGTSYDSPPLPKDATDAEDVANTSNTDEVVKTGVDAPVLKQYDPPLPFPLRGKKNFLDKQFEKFIEILKQLRISIPFADAISQIPSYAKFLKEILTKKRSLEVNACIELSEDCSAVIQRRLPPKLKDPGSFSIPCTIGDTESALALCDLGASVSLMPLSFCRKLGLTDLKDTSLILQLADRSVKRPVGILENVLVKIKNCYIPTDFVILDIEEDRRVPMILGRPFLATAGAMIDVKNGRLTLHVGDEHIEFK